MSVPGAQVTIAANEGFVAAVKPRPAAFFEKLTKHRASLGYNLRPPR
jgi:hypothetical protein